STEWARAHRARNGSRTVRTSPSPSSFADGRERPDRWLNPSGGVAPSAFGAARQPSLQSLLFASSILPRAIHTERQAHHPPDLSTRFYQILAVRAFKIMMRVRGLRRAGR